MAAESANESMLGEREKSGDAHWVELPLRECLQQSFDVFDRCKTKWGLVTDVRADGTTYKRHGIIATLTVAIKGFHDGWKCARTRQAVDLAKLALAVDRKAILPLLLRQELGRPRLSTDNMNTHPALDEDEIEALTRGDAPFELRLRFRVCASTDYVHEVEGPLVRRFMREMDQVDVAILRESPNALRSYLVKRVRATASMQRLVDLPVQAKITIRPTNGSSQEYNIPEDKSEKFFQNWSSATQALHLYQDSRAKRWQMETNHAPINVERITLDLSSVPMSEGVVEAVSVMASQGIPVSAKSVCLDIRLVTCGERELQSCLKLITTKSHRLLSINTGPMTYETMPTLDLNGQDFSLKILLILRCIGALEHEVKLEFGNLLLAFQSEWNRLFVARGLFDYILVRASPTRLHFFETEAMDNDWLLIDAEATRWNQFHPGEKLRLRTLQWSPDAHGIPYVRVLLRALHDVEEVAIYSEEEDFTAEDVQTVLRYPSLRSLHIGSVHVLSMDIFDTSADGKSTPALELLELSGLTLGDAQSMVPFIQRLDPSSTCASLLSKTLKTLGIAETEPPAIADAPNDRPDVRTAINDPAAVAALENVLSTNKVLQDVNVVGNFCIHPVWIAYNSFPNPLQRSHIPAPVGARRGEVVKARNAAFLSAVHNGSCVAMRSLDSNIVRLICMFSAPHTFRKVRL